MKKFLSFFASALLLGSMTITLTDCGDDGDDDDDAGGSSAGGLTPAGKAAQMVDLGLPSGTLWADRNVGAEAPEEYGDYFAWGETVPKSDYSWSTYKYGTAVSELTKYCFESSYGKDGYTDKYIELELQDDAASVNWGGNWRMPSKEQIKELLDNTYKTLVSNFEGTGVSGRKFTNKKDSSKFIFLPDAGGRGGTSLIDAGSHGYYWSRTLGTDYPSNAYSLDFHLSYVGWGGTSRFQGLPVRPVVAP